MWNHCFKEFMCFLVLDVQQCYSGSMVAILVISGLESFTYCFNGETMQCLFVPVPNLKIVWLLTDPHL